MTTDEELLRQSRALGDPTRLAVFCYLRDAGGPVSVAELTRHFGLNHNAIRQHLAKLQGADLVVGERGAPTGPGRPPLRYRPSPGAAGRWGGTSPYETLSLMLLELVDGQSSPRDVGRRTGRQLARDYGPDADALEIVEGVARRMGFEPRAVPTDSGADVVLEHCPLATTAAAAPGVVCELHLGIAEGIADVANDTATIAELVVQPPHRAGCRIRVTHDTPAA